MRNMSPVTIDYQITEYIGYRIIDMTVSHHLGMILIALPALVISLYVSAQM